MRGRNASTPLATAPEPETSRRGKFRHWHAALALLAVTFAVLGDVVFSPGQILSAHGADLSHLFLGVREFGFRELAHGRFPLWNPYLFGGTPFFAGFQAALLYPPNWIYAALPIGPAVNLDIAFHLWLSAMLMYAWATHRRLHPAAALLAGTVFMLGGSHFLHVYAGHLAQLSTIAWTPLVFLSIDAILDAATPRARWGWAIVGSAALALQVLAGFPQFVLYLGIIAAAYVVLRMATRLSSRAQAPALLAMLAFAGGISAVQWLTAAGVVAESARSHLPWSAASSYFLPPENLLLLIAPSAFGGGSGAPAYWGRWDFWEALPFIGLIPLVLATYAYAKASLREKLVFGGALLLSILFAFGPATPLFAFAYRYVPTADGFRGPSKFTLPLLAWLAILAGVGADRLLASDRRSRTKLMGALAALAAVLFAIAGFVFSSSQAGARGTWDGLLASLHWGGMRFQNPPTGADVTRLGAHLAAALALAGLTASLASATLFAGHRRSSWQRFAGFALVIMSVVELLAFARCFRPTFAVAQADRERDGLAQAASALPPDSRLFFSNPAAALRANVPTVWGNDAMVLRRYVDLAAALNGFDGVADPTASPFVRATPSQQLLRLGAVASISPRGDVLTRQVAAHPFPRALLMPMWKIVPDRLEAGRMLRDPSFPLRREVLLESDPGLPASAGGGPPPALAVGDLSTDSLEIDASTPVPCVLLITDNFARGWKATPLEPGPQPSYTVMPADIALRGVPLLPGHHHIRLDYQPTAFRLGKWVSIASLALWATLVGIWFKTSATSRQSSPIPQLKRP